MCRRTASPREVLRRAIDSPPPAVWQPPSFVDTDADQQPISRFATSRQREMVLTLTVIIHVVGRTLMVANVISKYIPMRLKKTYGSMCKYPSIHFYSFFSPNMSYLISLH
jgi:hypothetical protein